MPRTPATPRNGQSPIAVHEDSDQPLYLPATMLRWTLFVAIIAAIAGALGFVAMVGLTATIAKFVFFVFVALLLALLVASRRRPR